MTSLPPPPVQDPAALSLFLDIDGTLAEFERHPDEVGPTPRRTALLRNLAQRLDGRVAVISGRALHDMDRITERALEAASGVHGLELRRADGRLETAAPHPGVAAARQAFLALVQVHPSLVLEDKRLGLVLHYRCAPELEAVAHAEAGRLVDETGLALQRGDMMIEVRTPGRNKGDALTAFMDAPPFEHGRPVFIGDDVTDEDAFRAAVRLGGFGVLVGPQRPTAARYRLADVEAVLTWLEALAAGPLSAAAE